MLINEEILLFDYLPVTSHNTFSIATINTIIYSALEAIIVVKIQNGQSTKNIYSIGRLRLILKAA